MTAHYGHLTIDDRFELQCLWEGVVGRSAIDRRLGVHRSTITRELRHGSWRSERDHANLRMYSCHKLNTLAPYEHLYVAGETQRILDTITADRRHNPERNPAAVAVVRLPTTQPWTPRSTMPTCR